MNRREAYQKKMEAQLLEWKADIDKLKARAEGQGIDMQREFQEQIRELRTMQEAATTKLNKLKDTGDDAWEDLKEGIDTAWQSIGLKLRTAGSKFRETTESEPVGN